MLTEMPELGNISGEQAVSLAGLAPPSGHCCAMPCRTMNVTTIGEVVGERAHSRWSRRNATLFIFAAGGCNALQPRHEGQV
ncbi:hypothetical protein AB4874_13195 [Thioclava sp. 15-R06ZXC-3]|uniref:Uncharacterized protein n=1 Tax=Thioclava arctica TaxID=3238301 RepID=A0ABV3TM01_9RHOB